MGGAVARGEAWAQLLEEMEGEGQVSSGNGLTELETRHDAVLHTHNSLQARLEPGLRYREPAGPQHSLGMELELEEEDMFQAQGYLPLSPQTVRPEVQASTTGSSPTTQTGAPQSVGVVLQALPQQSLPLSLDYEGSGSPPQPFNQTL